MRIKGPKINVTTKASNSKGVVKQTLKMKKAGILIFTPIASKALQHQAGGRDQRLHPAGHRVTNSPEGVREISRTPSEVTGKGR